MLIVTPPPIAADIQLAMFRSLWPEGDSRSRDLAARIDMHAHAKGSAVLHAQDAVAQPDIGCDGVQACI